VRAARAADRAVAVRPARAFNYYGSKVAAAHRYPPPRHRQIIEPFAGGAGYALRHRTHEVLLVDKNPDVVGAWQFLINTPGEAILRLPLLSPGEKIPDDIAPGARLLIGWSTMICGAHPQIGLVPSAGSVPASFWGVGRRQSLAAIADSVKHWRTRVGDFSDAPDVEATWFIDAPYQGPLGACYPHSSKFIDYPRLAQWCRARRGQVMVCEGPGASWLPFSEHHTHASAPTHNRPGRRRSAESLWLGGTDETGAA
jgi:hypothetical protein